MLHFWSLMCDAGHIIEQTFNSTWLFSMGNAIFNERMLILDMYVIHPDEVNTTPFPSPTFSCSVHWLLLMPHLPSTTTPPHTSSSPTFPQLVVLDEQGCISSVEATETVQLEHTKQQGKLRPLFTWGGSETVQFNYLNELARWHRKWLWVQMCIACRLVCVK